MKRFLFTALASVFLTGSALAAPPDVKLVETDGNWQLQVDGKPFFIKGGGGDGPKDLLAELGGNSFRTWGIGDDTPGRLEKAEKHGLMVALGEWLGHERHGFSYDDPKALAEQKEQFRQHVLTYKDHPNVLLWSIGNEMEGFGEGDNVKIWKHVEELAKLAKELDPSRPTMTVIAEVGGKKVPMLHEHCPSIDIVGINSYGGGPSVGKRYKEAGGTKPYILTEFGPPGVWEVGKNEWGAPGEMTSTQKAEWYESVYRETIEGQRDKLCLGSYVFTWGFKQEATATWFGMFLPDGSKLASVDTLAELWSGEAPKNLCPVIEPIKLEGRPQVDPGATVKVSLDVSDPENDELEAKWRLHAEADEFKTGGDAEDETRYFKSALQEGDVNGATLVMPERPGSYRLYVEVRDGQGGAATASLPLRVNGERSADDIPIAGEEVDLPFKLVGDDVRGMPYTASGYMGAVDMIKMDDKWPIEPNTGKTATKVQYLAPGGWGGVLWQDPPNDWGDKPGGYNLTGATKLTFFAKGENGGEKVKFMLGALGQDKPFFDTAKVEKEFTLTDEWKQYELDLANKDLSRIKTGFGWVVAGSGKPIVFYLDDVAVEGKD